jgi:hypothetical protein
MSGVPGTAGQKCPKSIERLQSFLNSLLTHQNFLNYNETHPHFGFKKYKIYFFKTFIQI